MRPGIPHLRLAVVLMIAAAPVLGCAGRAVTRPVSEPGAAAPPPEVSISPQEPPPPSRQTASEPAPDQPPTGMQPDGIYHRLERGQTLYALSVAYDVPVATLIRVNHIDDPGRIPAGTRIFIPGATATARVSAPAAALLGWPLAGSITSAYGPRGRRGRHTGIDIDGAQGQRIRAAADGRVIKSGRGSGYGLMVILDHGDGLTTVYAHASKLLVFKGERVKRGQPIGKVGRSGNASGSHLHFEVRRNDRPVDPMPYLKNR